MTVLFRINLEIYLAHEYTTDVNYCLWFQMNGFDLDLTVSSCLDYVQGDMNQKVHVQLIRGKGFTLTRLIKTVDVDRFSKNVSFSMIFNRPHAVQKIRLFQHILNHRVVCSGGGGTTEKASTSITGSSSSSTIRFIPESKFIFEIWIRKW